MKRLSFFLVVFLIFIVGSCGNPESNKETGEYETILNSEYQGYDSNSINKNFSEDAIIFDEDDKAPEEISAIMKAIRTEYNSFSRFINYPQFIESTPEEGRYKVFGQFLEKRNGIETEKYYSTYVQKFDNKWEFGTLIIGNSPDPNLTSAIKVINGQLKTKEQESINKKESGSIDGINYTIIKRKEPNYIFIYTPNRLNKKDIIKLYNEFKDNYKSIRFTKSKNPDDDEYLEIQSNYVFEFDKNNIMKLEEYLN